MARVTYGALVTDISGSIGGSTFQRNNAGATARSRPSQKFFPSTLQSGSRNDFANISTSWSTLSLSIQSLWNAYALANPITDRWGNVRTLTGFQYYMQSNLNLLSLGLTLLASPPTYVAPDIVPNYTAVGYSNSLHLNFYPAINFPNSDLVIYATAPTTATKLTNRKNLYLIGGFSSPNGGIFDVTTMYANAFGLTWQSFFDFANCNIIFQLMLVNRVTGIASPFNGYVFSIRNGLPANYSTIGTIFPSETSITGFNASYNPLFISPNIVLLGCGTSTGNYLRSTDSGLNFTSMGNLGSQSTLYSFCDCGNGIVLLGTVPSGKIFRSTDFGLNFSEIVHGFPSTNISEITYLENGIVLAASGNSTGRIFRSTDFGLTWSDSGQLFSQVRIKSICYCGNGIVLASAGNSGLILRSIDYGLTWSSLGSVVTSLAINKLFYHRNGVILGGWSSGGKIAYSSDYGLTWSHSAQLFSQSSMNWIFSMNRLSILCLTGPGGLILQSTDEGLTWNSLGKKGSQNVLLGGCKIGNDKSIITNGIAAAYYQLSS